MRNFFLIVGGTLVTLALMLGMFIEDGTRRGDAHMQFATADLVHDLMGLALFGFALAVFGACLPRSRS